MTAPTAPLAQTITSLDLWHLSLPVRSRRDHGIGTVAGAVEVVIVRLTAEDGTEGYGEASPWSVFTGTTENAYSAIDRYMRPFIVGTRVDELAATMRGVERAVAFSTDAKAAVETALLDLTGRIAGVPLYTLLGGVFRREVPLSVSLADPDFDADLAFAERLAGEGIGIVKLKAGVSDHAFDMMRLEALRQRFPAFDVRVDYNQGLSPDEAMARVRAVDALAPGFIEQPVRADQFALMAKLRAATSAPLLADESVFGLADLSRAVRQDICDGVSVKIMKSGGPRAAVALAAAAEAAGLSAYGGDMFETGLAHLAGAHTVAAAPGITLGCEFYQAKYYLEVDILREPFPVIGGKVRLPERPGLGILPDPDKLAFYAIRRTETA